MSRTLRFLMTVSVLAGPVLIAQERVVLDPKALYKPLADDWTSYSGDYTGRRFSALAEINQSTVKNLTRVCRRVPAADAVAAAAGSAGPARR
jgi:alcohol dehydrogenase (cytochrome c)